MKDYKLINDNLKTDNKEIASYISKLQEKNEL
jgi:hypothetical protein